MGLSALFSPERVAVVGASDTGGSVGHAIVSNLRESFEGEVVPVNPNHETVLGQRCYDDLTEIEGAVDLAVVVDHALAVAGRFDATVHAVSVVEGEDDGTATAAVERVETRAGRDGIPVVTAVREGSPHGELLAYVEETGVDLVVMGTHGRTGLDRHLIGSVTDRVLRLGEVPVLAVHLGAGSGTAVGAAEGAVALAREAVADEGHDVEAVPERPYRTEGTWVVRVETGDAAFNVHVNATTGRTRLARLRVDDS